MRGLFKEEYGVDPSDTHWRSGGQEELGRGGRTPSQARWPYRSATHPTNKTFNRMLVDGELDAVFSARDISSFVNRLPNVGLLFPDYRRTEMEYPRRQLCSLGPL
jgi:4,5-dihydroxyphthalate decarboxylase